MIKAKAWNGKDLTGSWEVTLKIDGVRALWRTTGLLGKTFGWLSRANKPLYNIPPWRPGMPTDAEVYVNGSFKDTIRATRTKTLKTSDGCSLKKCRCVSPVAMATRSKLCPKWELATPVIHPEDLYSLDPLDLRLQGRAASLNNEMHSPKASTILWALEKANEAGYEGLVLRQGDTWLKVKPEETIDVLITGAVEGVGKHKGRLGALVTYRGEVGTGFSDEEREALWAKVTTTPHGYSAKMGLTSSPLVGQTIEVSCMQFTEEGKFRHPRFIRMRPDKVAEE